MAAGASGISWLQLSFFFPPLSTITKAITRQLCFRPSLVTGLLFPSGGFNIERPHRGGGRGSAVRAKNQISGQVVNEFWPKNVGVPILWTSFVDAPSPRTLQVTILRIDPGFLTRTVRRLSSHGNVGSSFVPSRHKVSPTASRRSSYSPLNSQLDCDVI